MMGPEETLLENFICGTRDLGGIEPATYLTPKNKLKGWLEGPTSKKTKREGCIEVILCFQSLFGQPSKEIKNFVHLLEVTDCDTRWVSLWHHLVEHKL